MIDFKLLRKHREFIEHVGAIVSGRSIAAVVGLLVTPVVARLFSPADFGVAASFLALAAMAVPVASLRYDAALALPRTEQEALLLAALCYRILPVFCVLLFGVIALLAVNASGWRTLELIGAWIWVLPFTLFLMGAQDIQESWLARTKSFGVISRSVVVETTLGGAARIAFGAVAGTSVYGLILGHLVGVVGRLILQGRAGAESLRATFRRIEWPKLREVARRYADFPRLNAPAGLVYTVGQNLPVLMFGLMYSASTAGFFAMANRLARIPVQIVATSVRRVYLQKAANIHNSGRSLRRSFVLATFGLLAIGLVPCFAIWMYGQSLLVWLLGDQWNSAGRFLEIIAPWVLIAWVSSPCNAIFVVLRKQDYWLKLQIILTPVRLSAFVAGYKLALGAEQTLGLFVLLAVLANVVTIMIALFLAGSTVLPPKSGAAIPNHDKETWQ
ncbi:MAG: oligosaccharide flippase family protein [Steroidobacteraceae bacterium]